MELETLSVGRSSLGGMLRIPPAGSSKVVLSTSSWLSSLLSCPSRASSRRKAGSRGRSRRTWTRNLTRLASMGHPSQHLPQITSCQFSFRGCCSSQHLSCQVCILTLVACCPYCARGPSGHGQSAETPAWTRATESSCRASISCKFTSNYNLQDILYSKRFF